MQWKIPLLCSLFLIVAVCADDDDDKTLTQKANAYIDEFIAKATNESGGFIDPLPLDDLGKSFEREVGFVVVKGEAKLYEGRITGLSSMTRKGDAVVIDLDDILMISCEMKFDKVAAFYRGKLTLNDLGPQFTLNAKISKAEVAIFLMVPSEGGEASIISANVKEFRDAKVSIWGLGPMGWGASLIGSMALNFLQKPAAKAASVAILAHFSKEIEKVPFPG